MIVYLNLEKAFDEKNTCGQILDCPKEMDFLKFDGKGFILTYEKTESTDRIFTDVVGLLSSFKCQKQAYKCKNWELQKEF